jgi:hypothetical protein
MKMGDMKMGDMKIHQRKVGPHLRRVIVDFIGALAVFWLVALAVSALHSKAYAIAMPPLAAAAAQLEAPAGTVGLDGAGSGLSPSAPPAALVMLSITLAAIAAFNLAFSRHLRRVYASQRRGVWRRD